jgi:hypothetical protein
MSRRIYNIVRPREGKDGKTFWDRHGAMIIDGDKISIHLDTIPVGEWNGWFNVYPKEEPEAQPQPQPQPQTRRVANADDYRRASGRAPTPQAELDDDIPF